MGHSASEIDPLGHCPVSGSDRKALPDQVTSDDVDAATGTPMETAVRLAYTKQAYGRLEMRQAERIAEVVRLRAEVERLRAEALDVCGITYGMLTAGVVDDHDRIMRAANELAEFARRLSGAPALDEESRSDD